MLMRSRKVGKHHTTPRNIPEERRSYIDMFADEYYLCILMKLRKTDLLQHNNVIIMLHYVLHVLKMQPSLSHKIYFRIFQASWLNTI
jgi:hypothetical protein